MLPVCVLSWSVCLPEWLFPLPGASFSDLDLRLAWGGGGIEKSPGTGN